MKRDNLTKIKEECNEILILMGSKTVPYQESRGAKISASTTKM